MTWINGERRAAEGPLEGPRTAAPALPNREVGMAATKRMRRPERRLAVVRRPRIGGELRRAVESVLARWYAERGRRYSVR
jgi:hypothetical protein